jgi:hypothetical protein
MTTVGSLYEKCGELFADYPLAARVVDYRAIVHSMVLALQEDGELRFFALTRDNRGRPFYTVSPWRAGGDILIIDADSSEEAPGWAYIAVTRAIPLPRHGSLFGWRWEDDVSAMIAVYAEHGPSSPEPSWAVMPRADSAEAQWPPFTGEQLPGHRFWKYYRAANVISLGGLIAETPASVFWVDMQATLGWSCCVVARDIVGSQGCTLRRGAYVYYEALRSGAAMPALDVLLSDASKIDLAGRF